MIRYFIKVIFAGNLVMKLISLGGGIIKVLQYEGFGGFCERIRMGVADLNKKIYGKFMREPIEPGLEEGAISGDVHRKVSIIIPTKDAGKEFEMILSAARGQKRIGEVELLVIDSESKDGTRELAERFGALIFKVDPDEFNHGLTRNFGAEKASGEYLVFTVQDAIPVNDHWLYTMIKGLETDVRIGAVTCKQFLQKNADLFSRFMNFNLYDSLQLKKDEVRFVRNAQEYDGLCPGDKRRVSQLDNVCTCFRRSTFESYRFRGAKYAEDLEIGSRMAMGGQRLAFLTSTGVFHSHNRSAVHFLKRAYTDGRLTPRFLKYTPGLPIIPQGISIGEILRDMKELYFCVGTSIQKLETCGQPEHITLRLGSIMRKQMKTPFFGKRSVEENLEKFFDAFGKRVRSKSEKERMKRPNVFADGFLIRFGRFKKYILDYEYLDGGNRSELTEACFKLLGLWLGQYLGDIANAKERQNKSWAEQEELDAFLSAGL